VKGLRRDEMRPLLVALALLLIVSGLGFACKDKDDDSDRVKELEQKIEALENRLGDDSAVPSTPSGDWFQDYIESGVPQRMMEQGERQREEQRQRELERRLRRLEAEPGLNPYY